MGTYTDSDQIVIHINTIIKMAEGYSEKDEKLIKAFHDLELSPKIEGPSDLLHFLKTFGHLIDDHEITEKSKSRGAYHYPKLSNFYGDESKGDVSWETFKFEVKSLLVEKTFSDEQLLLGVRRAVKGNAGDVVRRLGTGVTIHEVLEKLESTFGNIETKESILRKFYSCQQKLNESIVQYSSRLEEIFAQAVELKALDRKDDEKMKQVLYQGLLSELKHQAAYKNDIISDYDRFKIELRKMENELKLSSTENKGCKVAVNMKHQ